MTVEQAGDYYLDWICWSNKASDRYAALLKGTSWSTMTGKKYRAAAKRNAKIHREAAMALDAPPQPWPANVVKPVGKVVTLLLDEVDALNELAFVKSSDAAYRAWQDYIDGSNTGAQLTRLRLGLPSANSKNDGCKGKGKYPLAASDSATASGSPTPSASASS